MVDAMYAWLILNPKKFSENVDLFSEDKAPSQNKPNNMWIWHGYAKF